MRKLAVVVALIGAVALAAVATALEINSLRPTWGKIASAVVDSAVYTVHASNPGGLPSGLIVFNGAADEFWVRYWEDADGDGAWAYQTVAHGVPASLTFPRPSVERRGDSLYVKVELYCASDSLSYIWTDR